MGEYSPKAILDLYTRVAAVFPSAQLSGVLGDQSHVYGYHRARNVLSTQDYSVQVPEDQQGDGWAASALDITFKPADMVTVTKRLMASALDANDPRLNYCREFYGTVDGRTVTGYDTYFGYRTTSDDSHLWHIHLSFLRKYSNDPAALGAVYSVLVGQTFAEYRSGTSTLEDDVDLDKDKLAGTLDYPGRTAREAFTDIWQRAQFDLPLIKKDLVELRKELADIRALLTKQGPVLPPSVDTAALSRAIAEAVGNELADRLKDS